MQGATSQRSIFGYSVLQGLPAASLQETAACGAQGCVATLSELSDGTSSACRFYCRQRMKRPGTHEYFRKESLYGALCSIKVYHKLTDNSTSDSEYHLHSFLLPGRFFQTQLRRRVYTAHSVQLKHIINLRTTRPPIVKITCTAFSCPGDSFKRNSEGEFIRRTLFS